MMKLAEAGDSTMTDEVFDQIKKNVLSTGQVAPSISAIRCFITTGHIVPNHGSDQPAVMVFSEGKEQDPMAFSESNVATPAPPSRTRAIEK